MAMEPVYRPKGEVTAPLNGMFVGKSVYVYGKIAADARRFDVDLLTGDSFQGGDVALQVNPRFPGNVVIRNTRTNGSWGPEETDGGSPFKRGERFAIKITCTESHFVIAANDASFATYKHRLPFASITHVCVRGQCETTLVTSGIDGAEIPALTLGDKPSVGDYEIPFYSVEGRKIEIVGMPTDANGRFSINLLTEDDQNLFHYNPRLSVKQIVRNAKLDNWGPEEKDLGFEFPFIAGGPFQTTISVKADVFEVSINGVAAFNFANRVKGGVGSISKLRIHHDVAMERITYF